MLIGMDVDGVCFDFVGPVLDLVGNPFPRDKIKKWLFFGMFDAAQREVVFEALAHKKIWCDQPIISGAKEGIDLLRQLGHKIVFITAPWILCPEWGYIRRKRLVAELGAHNRDVMITCRKELVSTDILVDDRPETLDQCAALGRRVYRYPASYNEGLFHEVWSWDCGWLKRNFG
jgi:hypothetical protein